MGLLNRYILRQIWTPAVLAFVVISFLAMIGGIREYLEVLPLDQITILDLSRISLFSLPSLVGYIIPITFLMGILAAFGKLSQNHEIVVMKAAGVPLKRLVMPVVMAGVILSGLCFLIQDQLQPWAVSRIVKLIYSDLPLRASMDLLAPGTMHEFGGWRVYIGRKDARSGTLYNLMILKPEDEGQASAYYAKSARVERIEGNSRLVLREGYLIPPAKDGRIMPIVFEKSEINVPKLAEQERPAARAAQTLGQLLAREDKFTTEFAQTQSIPIYRELLKARNEIKDRLSFPLMCLAVALVAAPLGARAPRAGRSFVFASGFIILVTYFTLRSALEPNVLLPMPLVLAMGQVPNLLLCTAGLILIWRVDRV
ncbi:MAG: LptF/LptG family permease [Candidatus Hydrogenedentes bacterium]|nr:LptF/LptG family permease [Candidatus Hydrogenedentota bacterium]